MLSSVLSCNPAKLFMWRNYNYRSRAQRSRYEVFVKNARRPAWTSRCVRAFVVSRRPTNDTSTTPQPNPNTTDQQGDFRARVREAIRATTAAPTYFYPLVRRGMVHSDGALLANNPTAIAIHEAKVGG